MKARVETAKLAAVIVIVMGVVGAGKTTIGTLLARQLGWQFLDGDSFHSPANVEKMSRGIPLTDADRLPWLQAIREAIMQAIAEGRNLVLACSALKRSYREILLVGPGVKFLYLKANQDTIRRRLRNRRGHFATEELLSSQFAILEDPEHAVVVEAGGPPKEIVAEVRRQLAV